MVGLEFFEIFLLFSSSFVNLSGETLERKKFKNEIVLYTTLLSLNESDTNSACVLNGLTEVNS